MELSSLIFLVIIGIWAAYFVQYWVRRREHLATIRSVDAFSETMRVLQLRAPLPTVDVGGQAPRTYAVSPARAMRPQVTVKRAEAHVVRRDQPAVAAPAPLTPPASPARAVPFHAAEPEVARMRPSRAVRGIVLLVGALGTVVFGLLAVLGVLVAWAPAVPFVMALAGFAWLRAGVQGEIRARSAARSRASTRRPAARVGEAVVASSVPASDSSSAAPAEVEHETAHETVAETATAAPFDVSAPAPTQREPEVASADVVATADQVAAPVAEAVVAQAEVGLPEVDEDDIPLTWDPRPVPRPTYTMKARAAERPAPAPLEPAAEAELTAYEDEVPQRRIVGG